jgi:hypothetical protein
VGNDITQAGFAQPVCHGWRLVGSQLHRKSSTRSEESRRSSHQFAKNSQPVRAREERDLGFVGQLWGKLRSLGFR